MDDLTWVDRAQGIGAVLTPVLVAGLAFWLDRRQSRSGELLTARLDYYRSLAPELNLLMCYMTFVGDWKRLSPPDVIKLKRSLDGTFFCAAPLFGRDVLDSYNALMGRSFSTFNEWGSDAKLKTSAYRRRPLIQGWEPGWDAMFTVRDHQKITGSSLDELRQSHDDLVAAMIRDIDITRARPRYTTSDVSLNAHAPRRKDIPGEPRAAGPAASG